MIYAAFTIGLLGSLHCLGMCGPIAFALPVRTNNLWLKAVKYLLYNAGRVSMYGMLGLLVGMAGKGFALAGLQQTLSVVSGVAVILSAIVMYIPFRNFVTGKFSFLIKEKLKSAFQYHFRSSKWYSLFVLGSLNGLLPCGMVYAAILGALATGDSISGSFFMIAFGLGTLPMMMALSLSKSMMSVKLKTAFNNVTPVVACIIGALLILRGLNLDIPYVSPAVESNVVHKCH